MPDVTRSPRAFRFGVYEVDLRSGELRKHGLKVKLQEKPFQVLAMLLERPGEVVTREELRQRLWPADVFVDFDNSVNTAVNKLREALVDSAETPRYIETLPRRGYRFIAQVTEVEEAAPLQKAAEAPEPAAAAHAATPAPSAVPAPSPEPLPAPVPRPGPRLGRLAAVLLGLALIAGGAWWRWSRERAGLSATGKPISSLAVLPLANLSGDPGQEYFAEGMTDTLTTELAGIGALRVTSSNSAAQFKGSRAPISEIAGRLKVDAVVQGSVARSPEHVRITVQLVPASGDRHLWAGNYQRPLSDQVVLQSEVAHAIAREIQVRLTPGEQARLARARPVDPEVREYYLKGRHAWNRRTADGFLKAIKFFESAIAKQPAYAPAYAGLADTYNLLGYYSVLPPSEAYPKARAAAQKALEIDDMLAEAHASLAEVLQYEWDWSGAEREYRRALELNPNYATARQWYATYLTVMGRHEAALIEIRRAVELDPLSPIISADMGLDLYYARRYDEAIEQYRQTLELNPDFAPAHAWLGLAYAQKSQFDKAIASLHAAVSLYPEDPGAIAMLAYVYGASGNTREAQKWLARLTVLGRKRHVSAAYFAMVYVGLGNKEEAFAWAQKAYEERSALLARLKVLPLLDGIRSDPRFSDLVRRVGLPQ